MLVLHPKVKGVEEKEMKKENKDKEKKSIWRTMVSTPGTIGKQNYNAQNTMIQ